MNIFLSFSFRDEDKKLVQQVETLVRSQGLRPVTGRVLNGDAVTPAVLKKVEESDGLVAIMTRRDRLGAAEENRWRTHPWVKDEINHARAKALPTLAVFEEGVEVEGAYSENERIQLSLDEPLAAFLQLAERLANWKLRHGRTLLARIQPATLGHDLRGDAAVTCWYRFWDRGTVAEWTKGTLVPVEGGTQLFVHGVRDEADLIEVELRKHDEVVWSSPATSQHVPIHLHNGAE